MPWTTHSWVCLAGRRLTNAAWRYFEQRAWFGKPSTKRLMLSLGLVGAALYAANAFYVPASQCGSGVAEAAPKHSVTEDVQQTGSVDQTPRLTNGRSAKAGTELPDAGELAQGAEV